MKISLSLLNLFCETRKKFFELITRLFNYNSIYSAAYMRDKWAEQHQRQFERDNRIKHMKREKPQKQ